jgi:hypothetical protein
MTAYADTISRPVKTLTEAEQRALLKVTGQHVDGFRDHVIFSLAMGTGLREHELLALDVGDVFDDAGRAKRRVALRVFKRSAKEPVAQEVLLPDAVRAKLEAAPHDAQARGRDHHTHHAGLREPPRTTALGAPAPAPLRGLAGARRLRAPRGVSHAAPPRLQRRLPAVEGPPAHAEVRAPQVGGDDQHLHAPDGRRAAPGGPGARLLSPRRTRDPLAEQNRTRARARFPVRRSVSNRRAARFPKTDPLGNGPRHPGAGARRHEKRTPPPLRQVVGMRRPMPACRRRGPAW